MALERHKAIIFMIAGMMDQQTDPQTDPMDQDIQFPDTTSAFEFACRALDCTLEPYKPLPAMVMNAGGMFGSPAGVKREADGTQLAVLKIASSDGGFYVLSKTSNPGGPDLAVGDFVAWMPVEYSDDLANSGADERFGWLGMIFGTLDTRRESGSWVGKERFG